MSEPDSRDRLSWVCDHYGAVSAKWTFDFKLRKRVYFVEFPVCGGMAEGTGPTLADAIANAQEPDDD